MVSARALGDRSELFFEILDVVIDGVQAVPAGVDEEGIERHVERACPGGTGQPAGTYLVDDEQPSPKCLHVQVRWPTDFAKLCYRGHMNVSLTPELERFVDAKVESGLYNNASEVVREGLRLLKEQDDVRLRWREQIERGWQEAQAGRLVDGDEAFRRIDARLKKGAGRKRG